MQFWRVSQTPVNGLSKEIHFVGGLNSLAFSGSKENVSHQSQFLNLYDIDSLSSWFWENYFKVEDFNIFMKLNWSYFFYSSAIIHHLLQRFNSATAYFFFDGRDSQKDFQLHDKLIRSIIWQFSLKCGGRVPKVLVNLYACCGNGHREPTLDDLQNTLQKILDGFSSTFIFWMLLTNVLKEKSFLTGFRL